MYKCCWFTLIFICSSQKDSSVSLTSLIQTTFQAQNFEQDKANCQVSEWWAKHMSSTIYFTYFWGNRRESVSQNRRKSPYNISFCKLPNSQSTKESNISHSARGYKISSLTMGTHLLSFHCQAQRKANWTTNTHTAGSQKDQPIRTRIPVLSSKDPQPVASVASQTFHTENNCRGLSSVVFEFRSLALFATISVIGLRHTSLTPSFLPSSVI